MAPSPQRSELEQKRLLAAARDGSESAFEQLVAPHRAELHAHCYRMLGSFQDAEDALQEALLRAWRGIGRFEGRSSLRSWLHTIATNASLTAIERRPKRVLPAEHSPPSERDEPPGEPLVESIWIEPFPDEAIGLEDGFAAPEARYEQRESVELAFVAALQHLPANQRAVLLMREVLGFSAKEAAQTLDTSVVSVNSALQRARTTVQQRIPERSQQATLRALGDEAIDELVSRYVQAWESCDVDAFATMLSQEASFAMPPLSSWYRGREAIARWAARHPLSGAWRWRTLQTSANGQLALGFYAWNEQEGRRRAFALNVLTLGEANGTDGGRRKIEVLDVTAFIARAADPEPLRSADGTDGGVTLDETFVRYPDTPLHEQRVSAFFERFGLPAYLD